MMNRLLIGTFILVQILAADPDHPMWAEVFHQNFVQSYANASHIRVSGKFQFDAKRDMMRIDRQDGVHDPICGSILPNVSGPCTQLIRDKKRYIVHPEKRICCMCCDAAHGCGTLKRDWLSGAKYLGQQTLSGQSFYKWSIMDGNMTDYYYDRKTDRVPRRFTTGQRSVQDWIMNTYSTQAIPDSVFTLPDYCKSTCPATTVCGKFQLSSVKQQ